MKQTKIKAVPCVGVCIFFFSFPSLWINKNDLQLRSFCNWPPNPTNKPPLAGWSIGSCGLSSQPQIMHWNWSPALLLFLSASSRWSKKKQAKSSTKTLHFTGERFGYIPVMWPRQNISWRSMEPWNDWQGQRGSSTTTNNRKLTIS